jgi:hypothetical protein
VKHPNFEEQKRLARLWSDTGPKLEAIRREALRDKPYDSTEVEELLALGDNYDGPPRLSSGLEEMQRIFMRAAPDWYLKARAERMRKG